MCDPSVAIGVKLTSNRRRETLIIEDPERGLPDGEARTAKFEERFELGLVLRQCVKTPNVEAIAMELTPVASYGSP
jgi:hypothetical protein